MKQVIGFFWGEDDVLPPDLRPTWKFLAELIRWIVLICAIPTALIFIAILLITPVLFWYRFVAGPAIYHVWSWATAVL